MKLTPVVKNCLIVPCLMLASRAWAAAPTAPTVLTAVPVYGSNQVRLEWQDNSANETGFRIERKTAGGSFGTVASLGANVQDHTDGTVSAGIEYTYRVAAFNADGDALSNESKNTISVTWTLSNGNHEMMNSWEDGTPNNNWGFHEGIDIQDDGQGGQAVVAARGGIINFKSTTTPCPGHNLAIEVRQGTRIFTDLYCHMQSLTAKTVGEAVTPGEKIGEISTSAYGAGTRHVHQMLIDGAYALPADGNTFRNPFSIFTAAADQDPGGANPALQDLNADGNLILYKRPDNSYFPTGAIFGDVDISAEITESMGANPPVGVHRAGYWVDGGPPASEAVRSAAAPYLLHNFDAWFGQSGVLNNFTAIYDPDQETTQLFRKRFHHLLTNTRGTDGSVANLDASQVWRTAARKSTGTQPNGSDAQLARENQEARFPDGTYFVHVLAADFIHSAEQARPVLVDNSRPYVRRVTVYSGARIVYQSLWEWNAGAAQLAIQPATFAAAAAFTAFRTQDIALEFEFSEPMATATITAVTPTGGVSALPAAPTLTSLQPAEARIIWRGLISNLDIDDNGAHDGIHLLTIEGTDLAGNALLQINNRTASGPDHHNRNAGGALQGTAGTDTIHGFRIGPLEGTVPVTAIFMKTTAADPAAPTVAQQALAIEQALHAYFSEVSYGEIDFAVTGHGWYQLDHPLTWYETNPQTPLVDLVQEALDAAQSNGVNIDSTDYLLVVTDENAARTEWSTNGAWPYAVTAAPGWRLMAAGTLNLASTDPHLTNLAGRMVGLVDLFAYPEVTVARPFVGPWSHMSDKEHDVHPLGWEKWRAGWLDETGAATGNTLTRVAKPAAAAPIVNQSYTLRPMDLDDNATKMVAVTAGDRLYYTAEYRRQQHLDSSLPDAGVLITKTNDYVNQGEGPAIIQESAVTSGDLNDAPHTATSPRNVFNDIGSGVKIEVTALNANEAQIRLDYAVPPTENDVYVSAHDERWQAADIWVDAPDLAGNFAADPLSVINANEKPVVGDLNKIYGRVRNQGHADATNFEVHLEIREPWAAGGPFRSLKVETVTLLQGQDTNPGAYYLISGDWTPSGDVHSCVKLTVLGVANDNNAENNWTQENVSEFATTRGSPFAPVTTRFEVENPFDETITAFFKLDGLPESWSYILTPQRLTVGPRGVGSAQVTVQPAAAAPVCSRETVTVSAYTPRVDTLKQLGAITLQIGLKNAATIDAKTSTHCGRLDPKSGAQLTPATVFDRTCALTTEGCTTPPQPNVQVAVVYTAPDGGKQVRYVTTDASGCYSDTVTVTKPDLWATQVVLEESACREEARTPPQRGGPSGGAATICRVLWVLLLIALIAAVVWFARWRGNIPAARWPLLIALAATLVLGWLLLKRCAINPCWFWLSVALAVIFALVLVILRRAR